MVRGAETAGPDRAAVLVVDDEPANRLLLRAHLSAGYEVLEAEDAESALRVLDRHRADMVILDVMMPGVSGYELCHLIKERSSQEFLPILLVTALENQGARNAGLEAGADDFLTKPVDKRELLLRVRSFLRLREQDAMIRKQLEELRHLQTLNESLFSLIIHDLRNPLGCVESYIRLAQDEPDFPGQAQRREYMDRAYESARELESLLEEVLKVRLLEEGKLMLAREPVALGQLVGRAVESVRAASKALKVGIELSGEGEAEVSLDYNLARCAVQNLITNAITFSSAEDTVAVTVRAEGGGASIEVADRGPGVPDELKGDVFEKYGSVEAWRGASRRGLGLGLHLVKLVATAHGGNVSVRDREGGGTVFRLFLAGQSASQALAAGG